MKEKIINNIIRDLIEEKDKVSDDIAEITTFVDLLSPDKSLSKWDIEYINKRRNELSIYYEIIDDLEELKKKTEVI